MKRVLGFLSAAALGFSCFAAPAKIATQDWVKNALAAAGVRVSAAVVETNVSISITGTVVTNLAFTSAYTCPEVPDCRSISFTVGPAQTAYRQSMTPKTRSLLDLLLLKAYADGEIDRTITMTILSGYWTDKAGRNHEFIFENGWVLELGVDNLPEMPSGAHQCVLDTDCVCKYSEMTEEDFAADAKYQEFEDIGHVDFAAEYGAMENWIDLSAWGSASWQKVQRLPNGNVVYSIEDDQGLWFNLENLWKSDALAEAMLNTVKEINSYLKECRDKYVEINSCKKKDPQHDWSSTMCGAFAWKSCRRNGAHTEGVERHQYDAYSGKTLAEHFCRCGKTSQEHHWTVWMVRTITGAEVVFSRSCPVCNLEDEYRKPLSDFTECNAEIGLHVPKDKDESVCGCKCGYYGVNAQSADSTEFHRWSSTQDCRCTCKKKHEFRKGSACPKVCASCKEMLSDGRAARESDHTKASGHICGCACGYYGVTSDHSASGHYAETAYLHKQASVHGNGIPSFCQCYGAEGTGGFWHWRTARSQTCSRICTYRRGDIDPLGHLAAKSNPEKGITPAKPTDHTPKTYGCGCSCGLCNEDNRAKWMYEKSLHRAAQSAEDQCHCACESRELVGKTEGHTFKTCICTCKEKHDPKKSLNACGYCSTCGFIWRNGVRLDAGNRNNHLWVNGGCYCDGGCVVGGVKMLHADGHRYMKNKCICLCGEATREHILVEQKERVGQWTCWKCNAVFLNFRVTTVCSRCEATVSTEHIGSVGEHFPGCGEPKPSCWKCGCHCTTWGTHTTCNIHYCNACCTKKPPKPPRPPKPTPDDPNPDEPEPEPPEPYVTCKHPRTETEDWDFHWTCEKCSSDFHNWGWRKYCADCGVYIDSESHNEGRHGPPCNGEGEGEDPGHVCEPSLCGEALNDGGTCSESFCPSCESCPNTSQHKNHHGGNGGSGGGGLEII